MALPTARMGLAFGAGTPDADAGKRIKTIVRAVIEGEVGVDPLADAALANAEDYYNARTKGARARWNNAKQAGSDAKQGWKDAKQNEEDAKQGKSDALTDIPTYRHTDKQTTDRQGGGSVGSGMEEEESSTPPLVVPDPTTEPTTDSKTGWGTGPEGPGAQRVFSCFQKDPLGYLPSVPTSMIPDCACLYFGDADQQKAKAGYGKLVRRHGSETFKRVFELYARLDRYGMHNGIDRPGAHFTSEFERLAREVDGGRSVAEVAEAISARSGRSERRGRSVGPTTQAQLYDEDPFG